MLGIRSEAKARPVVTRTHRAGPTLLPKEKRPDRKVFLPESMWEELTRAAEFHQAAFEAIERTDSVSRNDLIENFLRWALDEYWDRVGGRPTPADRQKKIAMLAKRITEEEAEVAKAAKAAADLGESR